VEGYQRNFREVVDCGSQEKNVFDYKFCPPNNKTKQKITITTAAANESITLVL